MTRRCSDHLQPISYLSVNKLRNLLVLHGIQKFPPIFRHTFACEFHLTIYRRNLRRVNPNPATKPRIHTIGKKELILSPRTSMDINSLLVQGSAVLSVSRSLKRVTDIKESRR